MKFPFIVLIFFCFSFQAFGQEKVDSLFQVWENNIEDDTTRLNALSHYTTKKYLYSKPDSAFQLAKIAYDYAESKGLEKAMAQNLNIMGIASAFLSNYSEAITLQERSIEISQKTKNNNQLTYSLRSLGNTYLKKSDYLNAINYYSESLKRAKEVGNKEQIAASLNNVGLVQMDLKHFDKALKYLKDALSIYDEINADKNQSNCLNNIGALYRKEGNYSIALEYFEKSLKIKQENNIQHGLAICFINIGLIYHKQENDIDAIKNIQKGLDMHRESGNKKGIANALYNLGNIYQKIDIDTAFILGNQALKLAQETENIQEIRDAANLLYKIYSAKGKYNNALEMNVLFQKMKDKILNAENQKAAFLTEYECKLEKKLLETQQNFNEDLTEQKLKLQQQRWLFLLVFLLATSGLFYYLKNSRKKADTKRKELLSKIEALKKKLAIQSVSSSNKRMELTLDKEKIEKAINTKLGDSSWLILNIIFNDPSISNKDIAKAVFLSVEGVSSSLRRMYTAFGIKASSNKKITLLMKAVHISVQ